MIIDIVSDEEHEFDHHKERLFPVLFPSESSKCQEVSLQLNDIEPRGSDLKLGDREQGGG